MNACHICDVDLLDDPHWHDELEVLVCDRCCPNEGCLLLPGDGSAPDEAPSSATGDDSAPHSAVVPAAGGSSLLDGAA